jgi:hypothetical protein
MDQDLAGSVVRLLWMADRNLYQAFELVHKSEPTEDARTLEHSILATMRDVQVRIIHPIYERFPELRPSTTPEPHSGSD